MSPQNYLLFPKLTLIFRFLVLIRPKHARSICVIQVVDSLLKSDGLSSAFGDSLKVEITPQYCIGQAYVTGYPDLETVSGDLSTHFMH